MSPPPQGVIFGRSIEEDTWGEAIALPTTDLTHMHIIGMTGHGKSSLLTAIAYPLIRQGTGVTVVDPGGELCRPILKRLITSGFFEAYPDAFARFVYLDIARAYDRGLYFPFNILNGSYDPYTAGNIVYESFLRVWSALQDRTATNIDLVTKISCYVLAYNDLPLLPYLDYLLTDADFRKGMLATIPDKLIEKWFRDLGIENDKKALASIVETTLKRSDLLAFAPVIRYTLGQRENRLNFAELLENNRSVALNIHIVDPDAKRLFGCLFTVQAEIVAKSRRDIPPEKRDERYLIIIDEMQNFISQSQDAFENLFAESRRANVRLLVAHQHWGQLPKEFHESLTQCRTKVVFNLDPDHARISAEQLGLPVSPLRVKPQRFSMSLNERPQYYTLEEQWQLHAMSINKLKLREAFIRLPTNDVRKIQTIAVPDIVDEKRLAEVEEEYLRLYFTSQAQIEQEIEQIRQGMIPSLSSTPSATVQTAEPEPAPLPPTSTKHYKAPPPPTKTQQANARKQVPQPPVASPQPEPNEPPQEQPSNHAPSNDVQEKRGSQNIPHSRKHASQRTPKRKDYLPENEDDLI